MNKLYPEFFNDVFGPIMQPGSSSHMAGPCRVGLMASSLLGEETAEVLIELDEAGSIASTLGTMNEDVGMLNGALGRELTDPDFFDVIPQMKERGIPYDIRLCAMKESAHPNAVKFTLTGRSGKRVTLVGNSIGGGMMETVWVNGYAFSGKGDCYVLCLFDEQAALDHEALVQRLAPVQELLDHGVGKAQKGAGVMHWFKSDRGPSQAQLDALPALPWGLLRPVLPVITHRERKDQLFTTVTRWRELAEEQHKPLWEVAVDYEVAASCWSREQVVSYMRNVVMKTMYRRVHAIAEGEAVPASNPYTALSYQNWGQKQAGMQLVDGLFAKAIYYVFSARPQCPGVLNVPGPQGNGGGFLFGVLSAVQEERGLSDEDVLRGLFIAAGIGAICYTLTAPTGEVIGCAGECGCCSAMAAAAVAEMMHGTPQQVEAAASFALQGAVGWPCDIIPGGKGMPCASRILYIASMSIVFAQWALIDEDPVLPFHEVVDVADRLGRTLPPELHCTGHGGMCDEPSARRCTARFREWYKHKYDT